MLGSQSSRVGAPVHACDRLYACAAPREKAEIQALSAFGFQYLTKDYLPAKLRAGDWC